MTRNPESDLANIDSALSDAKKQLWRVLELVREARRVVKRNYESTDPVFATLEGAAAYAQDHIEKAIDALDEVVE